MKKQIFHVAGMLLLLTALAACSSPEEKAAGYIENAGDLAQEGNLKKAELEYKNALQINQNLPDAWYGLARIHERRQEWKQVYGTLNKVREMAPNHVDGRIMLAQVLLAANQLDQALTDATEILEMAPDDVRSHTLMAAVHFRLENFDGARQEVDKALAIDSDNSEALLVRARMLIAEKRYDEALAVLDAATENDRDNVSFYLMKIQAYSETGDRQSIEKVYLALIVQFPANVTFKQALARHYLQDKDIDSAESVLLQITASDAEDVAARVRFVAFKRQHRSLDDAIALVKSYIDENKEEYRYRIMLGELYVAGDQIDKAVDVYQGIVEDDGTQTNGLEARNKIALVELRKGNRDRASTLIDEVLAQDKSNENALLMQAGLQIADGKFDDAIVSARTVLRDNPDSIKALGLLGQAYSASGSSELALETFTRAFQISPGTSVIANKLASDLLRQRKAVQAGEILQKSLAGGNRSVEAIKLMAQVKLALGEWDQAEQLAKQLQSVEGQEALSQQLLGAVYQGKDEQGASIEAFKRAHELAPDASQPVVALVQTYVRSGKPDEARRFLESILAVDADNVTAHLLLGQLSLAEQAPAEAIKHLNAIVDSNPELEIGYRSLASVYLSQNDAGAAESVMKKGIAAIPGSVALSMSLANIYERQGEFDKAIDLYQSLLEKNDDLLVAKNNLASLLTDYRGDPASLEQARTIAAELRSSQIPQFLDTYAWASVMASTNLEEAIVILEGVVKENGQVDVYAYHLGEAYRRNGDSENAMTYLSKAVEIAEPGSDVAVKANASLQQIK